MATWFSFFECMHKLLIALAFLIATPVQADIYKCVRSDAISYQETPCDRTSTASKVVSGNAGTGSAWPWSGLKYGATIEEVQKIIPNVKQEKGSHLYDGSKVMLKKEDVIVAGINFEASYFLKTENSLRST